MLDEFCLNPCRRTLNLDKLACFGFSLRCSWMQQTTASFLWCRLSHVLTAFRFGCYTYFSIWDATQKHLETLFSSVSSLSLSVLSLGLSAALSSSRSLCHCHWTQFSASDLNSPTGPVWQLWRSRSETKHKTLAEMDLAALPDSLPAQGSRETKPWAIRFRKMILRFDWCTDA